MLRHTIFALFIGMLIFFLYLAQYLGAFRSVTMGIENHPEMTLVYQEHFGAYHKIVPTIEGVEKTLKENNFDCSTSFGEFLDNPKNTEEERLKSNGGCLVKKDELTKVTAAFSVKSDASPFKDLKLKTLPAKRYVVAHFEGSPGIGPMKVYPKVQDFIGENQLTPDGAILETYEIHSKESMSTTYYFPIK